MILTKTPLRISFFGGGSDIPEFSDEHRGLVVSTAINKYIYIALNECVAPHLKVVYSELELETDLEKIKHDRVRESLRVYGIKSNIEIASFSDVPTKGTGLGSSSTFTVGLIKALHTSHVKTYMSPETLATMACHVEIEMCKEPIGKQDQWAAAVGGFNSYEFHQKKTTVKKLKLSYETKDSLHRNLMLFNTGQTRMASSVLSGQVENLKTGVNVDFTKSMVNMAEHSIKLLRDNKIDDFGRLLDDAWQIKKKMASGISNAHIDEMYETAAKAGALGGKILGAGGGGYLLLYVPDAYHTSVLEAMSSFERLNFKFCQEGSTVEMNSWT